MSDWTTTHVTPIAPGVTAESASAPTAAGKPRGLDFGLDRLEDAPVKVRWSVVALLSQVNGEGETRVIAGYLASDGTVRPVESSWTINTSGQWETPLNH